MQAGFLVRGRGFAYDDLYGIPGRPGSKQAIELTARFNYTNLNDGRAGIMGGRESDVSLGANFYLNEYLAVKLNGSYVLVGEHCNEILQEKPILGAITCPIYFLRQPSSDFSDS